MGGRDRDRWRSRNMSMNMFQVTPAVMKYIKYVDYIKMNGKVTD
jgi:hypothetical protein